MRHGLVVVGLFMPLLVLGAIPLQLASEAGASPNPIPVMSIVFSQSGVTGYPSEYAPGMVSLDATLTIDKIPGERLVVELTGSTDTGWFVSFSPPELLLTTNKIVSFMVFVQVPINCPASYVGILHVEARGKGASFQPLATAEAIVSVAPFYRVFVTSPLPYKEVPPGSDLTFVMDVQNRGNSVDTFSLDITNQGDLADNGWTVSFSMATVARIGPLQTKSVKLFVIAPKITTIYKTVPTQILVTVHSVGSQESGQDRNFFMPFIVYERGSYFDPYTGLGIAILIVIVVPIVWAARRLRRRQNARKAAETPDEEKAEGQD